MCSPSRSQSVHMTSAVARLAWSSMFLAMDLLSYSGVSFQRTGFKTTVDIAYIWDHRQHGCVKQPIGRRVLPLLEVGRKLDGCQMPLDGCHGHGAVSPWRAKVVVKRVVFDVSIARVCLRRCQRCVLEAKRNQSNNTQFGTGRPRGDLRPPLRWRAFQPHREPASWLPLSTVE